MGMERWRSVTRSLNCSTEWSKELIGRPGKVDTLDGFLDSPNGELRLSDDRRVDVREDVLAHVVSTDRRDDRARWHADNEGVLIDQDDGRAGALGGCTIDALTKPARGVGIDADAAPLEALERVAGEVHRADFVVGAVAGAVAAVRSRSTCANAGPEDVC
jgi:hypothetical protein